LAFESGAAENHLKSMVKALMAAKAAVQSWVDEHANSPKALVGNERVKLEETVRPLLPLGKRNKVKTFVNNQLSRRRPIIDPKSTNYKYAKKAVGQAAGQAPSEKKKSNAINNPGWNAINSPAAAAAVKAETEARNLEMIRDNPDLVKHLMEEDEIEDIVEELWNTRFETLDGQTLSENFESGKKAVYIFLTKQLIEKESARFLTERGALPKEGEPDKRNRPVFEDTEGKVIGREALIADCGMRDEFIHKSLLRWNEAKIEAALQDRAQHFPLGLRLHRQSCMGPTMLWSNPADLKVLTFVGITTFPILAGFTMLHREGPHAGKWSEMDLGSATRSTTVCIQH